MEQHLMTKTVDTFFWRGELRKQNCCQKLFGLKESKATKSNLKKLWTKILVRRGEETKSND